MLLVRETRQPYPSSCGISFSLRELRRVNNALICHPIPPSPTFSYSSLSTDKGHNVEGIEGMLPEGVQGFKSDMGKDYVLTLTAEGLYGVKCTPHYTMGMVGLIQAGAPVNRDAAAAVTHKGKAKTRFEPLFGQVAQ
ncbi:MAG: plastocyanin/azurin family copper-binding protein [Tabrizicola sp.]|uniref:plastocyanin/azurin family copper-binding protein n=1 Tax=Tabrizicola sp. TaxID=2005166 RepID=UPI00273401AF|nr:plastocyanin/azurin family copper-binding protein [Tabrizicola sp.]MDP3264470.1 plastocyanin/azurin family copper-binding protein [Tabrizicola sp.]MDP3646516.1 plastocyanin/azurin family copper-binding protein [Paracoccaceae bacterium]